MPLERIQKILARAGYGSRRASESLITEGRVTVDDVVITQLGSKADPDTQKIAVDLQPIKIEAKVYLLLNKPKGMICSSVDPAGRPLAVQLPGIKERIFSVGRLDEETSGLLLLTNDGEWANLLAHPRYKIEKTYQARVVGEISNEALGKLRSGVHLSDGKTSPAWVEYVKRGSKVSHLVVTIREGMNRQVRRMLAAVGLKCIDLRRTAIGPLSLEKMQPGQFRSLFPREVEKLRKFAQKAPDPKHLEELAAHIAKLEAEGPAGESRLRDARKQMAQMRWRLGLPIEPHSYHPDDRKPWKKTVPRERHPADSDDTQQHPVPGRAPSQAQDDEIDPNNPLRGQPKNTGGSGGQHARDNRGHRDSRGGRGSYAGGHSGRGGGRDFQAAREERANRDHRDHRRDGRPGREAREDHAGREGRDNRREGGAHRGGFGGPRPGRDSGSTSRGGPRESGGYRGGRGPGGPGGPRGPHSGAENRDSRSPRPASREGREGGRGGRPAGRPGGRPGGFGGRSGGGRFSSGSGGGAGGSGGRPGAGGGGFRGGRPGGRSGGRGGPRGGRPGSGGGGRPSGGRGRPSGGGGRPPR